MPDTPVLAHALEPTPLSADAGAPDGLGSTDIPDDMSRSEVGAKLMSADGSKVDLATWLHEELSNPYEVVEVAISPEMMEAGIIELAAYGPDDSPEVAVESIFLAMIDRMLR